MKNLFRSQSKRPADATPPLAGFGAANPATARTPSARDLAPDPVMDTTIETFERDVLQASMTMPVIVDFWATWCGPCKQLTPSLEKVVRAAGGAVRLVKVDIDKNQMLAGQLRIQSVPTVYAFFQGRPVDGFQGAIPESAIVEFVDRLKAMSGVGAGPEASLEEVLAAAEAALEAGEAADAAQLFAEVASATAGDPKSVGVKALAGLARCHLALKDPERARQVLEAVPEDLRADPALAPVKAALALASGNVDSRRLAALRVAAEASPEDLGARFAYAEALIGAGEMDAGVTALLDLVAADRTWDEAAARRKLLTVFEALGPAHPLTVQGRRRLSSILFS